MRSPLLAWQDDHDDSDAGNVIVFARTELQARAKVARERGMALEEAAVIRRPGLDTHAPGPVPAEALLAEGWWLECGHCYHRVREEGCDDCWDALEDEDALYPEVVCLGEEAFCSAACRDAAVEERREYREGAARTWAEVLRRWPEAERWNVWCDHARGWAASFRLPSVDGVIDWWASDPEHISLPLFPGSDNVRAVRELGSAPEERWESEGGAP